MLPGCAAGVCATALGRVIGRAAKPDNAGVLGISADLPFAQARFGGAEGLERVVMLSTMRRHEFLENYGVAIAEGPLAGVAARAVWSWTRTTPSCTRSWSARSAKNPITTPRLPPWPDHGVKPPRRDTARRNGQRHYTGRAQLSTQ